MVACDRCQVAWHLLLSKSVRLSDFVALVGIALVAGAVTGIAGFGFGLVAVATLAAVQSLRGGRHGQRDLAGRLLIQPVDGQG